MAKSETRQFLDISADDLSAEAQELLRQDRALYDQQKALRKRIVEEINTTFDMPADYQATGIAFTRWGQLQVAVDRKQAAKATTQRKTLADFLASQAASGARG